MIDLANLLFEPVILKENFISKLDTRLKIILCGKALLFNLILPGNFFQIGLLIFYFGIALGWQVKIRYILGRLFMPFIIGFLLIITGLAKLHLALVILAGVSAVGLLSFSTPFEDMLSALSKLKCPPIFIEITFLMYKYVFIFFEEIETIYHAQSCRLGYLSFNNRFRSLSILIGMLIIRSFARAETAYEAILARGYKDRLFY